MKILLFGSDGQVGHELSKTLSPLGELIAYNRRQANFVHPARIASLVEAHRPHVVVNAAAYTAVDKAEAEPELAHLVNAGAVAAIAEATRKIGGWLVHYSTDYVFDGEKAGPYAETDATNPLNVYGQTKRDGEQAIALSGCWHLIFRTSWVFGPHGRNFAESILRLAHEKKELRVVSDQIGAPTSTEMIAEITASVLLKIMHETMLERYSGIYHLTAGGATSWHGYARHLIAEALAHEEILALGPEQVVAIPTSAYPSAAQRPSNSLLDTQKLRETFDISLPEWRTHVSRFVMQSIDGNLS